MNRVNHQTLRPAGEVNLKHINSSNEMYFFLTISAYHSPLLLLSGSGGLTSGVWTLRDSLPGLPFSFGQFVCAALLACCEETVPIDKINGSLAI